MTALAAYVNFGADGPGSACGAMLDAQAIYGHESRSRVLGRAMVGRRFWPLTPEDAFDTGPLVSADGRLLFCADARIDNRGDLSAMLSLPEPLDRTSDAALVFAAYEAWGEAAFDRLCGAYAVVIWDNEQQTLLLARDPMGERPLHYHVGDGFIAAASMPKGLHALPAIPRAARTASMADFLALIPETGTESFFEGVERVTPGHVTVIDREGHVRSHAHWNPPLATLHLASDGDYAAAMRSALDDAVACRLRRPSGALGCHLSAGLDSSSVTTTAARLSAPERLVAFTSVPSGSVSTAHHVISDEGSLAGATAAMHGNIDHVCVTTNGASPLAGLDRHHQLFERPVLNPCNAVWTDAINDAAKVRGVTVMLTGQMGNLSISHGGLQELSQLARRGAFPALFGLMWQMRRRGHRWPGLAAQAIGPFLPPAAWAWLARKFDRALDLDRYSALRPEAFDAFAVSDRAQQRGLDLSYRPWSDSKAMRLWALRRTDLGVYNKGVLAGWGIDMRDPTADRRVIELSLRIPERQFILNGETRSLVRRAFADRLPAAVIAERRRGAQAADWHLGFASAHAAIGEELAAFERNPQACEIIDVDRLMRAHAGWHECDPGTEAAQWVYRTTMLRALAAGHFLRKVARTN
jgi:asparagine synthase (glutamine-hydrolysing)